MQTGTSTRVYFTKRGGASFGQSHGLRTLCASCAASLDQSRQGMGKRLGAAMAVGLLSVLAALRLKVDSSAGSVLFLFLLTGGPGWITFLVLQRLHAKGGAVENNNRAEVLQERDEPPLRSNQQESISAPQQDQQSAMQDVEPYPGIATVVGRLHSRLRDQGISLMGCYGFDESLDGAKATIERLVLIKPPRYFGNLDDWVEEMYRETAARFVKEAGAVFDAVSAAVRAGDSDRAVTEFEPFFKLFPMASEEDFDRYIERLQGIVEHLSTPHQ